MVAEFDPHVCPHTGTHPDEFTYVPLPSGPAFVRHWVGK